MNFGSKLTLQFGLSQAAKSSTCKICSNHSILDKPAKRQAGIIIRLATQTSVCKFPCKSQNQNPCTSDNSIAVSRHVRRPRECLPQNPQRWLHPTTAPPCSTHAPLSISHPRTTPHLYHFCTSGLHCAPVVASFSITCMTSSRKAQQPHTSVHMQQMQASRIWSQINTLHNEQQLHKHYKRVV